MWTFIKRYSIPILVSLGLCVVVFGLYKQNRSLQNVLSVSRTELEKAKLDIGRAETKFVKQADLQRSVIDKLNKQITDDIKERRALIISFGEMQAKYEAEKNKVKTVTKLIIEEREKRVGIDLPEGKLFVKRATGEYNEVKSIEYSYEDFRLSLNGDAIAKTLNYKLHQRFRGEIVKSKLPDGTINNYVVVYEVDDKNKDVGKLQLTSLKFLEANQLSSRMYWFDPKLDIGLHLGVNQTADFTPIGEIGFSFSGYGKTENDLTWRFFRLGAGISSDGFNLSFSPAQLNIAQWLPVLSNLWLTPLAGFSFNQMKANAGLGISDVF